MKKSFIPKIVHIHFHTKTILKTTHAFSQHWQTIPSHNPSNSVDSDYSNRLYYWLELY